MRLNTLFSYVSLKSGFLLSFSYVNPKNGKAAGMISKETYDVVMENAQLLDSSIIYDRDFHYNL